MWFWLTSKDLAITTYLCEAGSKQLGVCQILPQLFTSGFIQMFTIEKSFEKTKLLFSQHYVFKKAVSDIVVSLETVSKQTIKLRVPESFRLIALKNY